MGAKMTASSPIRGAAKPASGRPPAPSSGQVGQRPRAELRAAEGLALVAEEVADGDQQVVVRLVREVLIAQEAAATEPAAAAGEQEGHVVLVVGRRLGEFRAEEHHALV